MYIICILIFYSLRKGDTALAKHIAFIDMFMMMCKGMEMPVLSVAK